MGTHCSVDRDGCLICTVLEDTIVRKDRELETLKAQKNAIVSELNLASQTQLKRGEDFSDSIRLLETRLTESSNEAAALRTSLGLEKETNARLSAELYDANALMSQYSNQTADSTSSIKLIQVLRSVPTCTRLQ